MPTFTIEDAPAAATPKFTIGDDTTHAAAAARVAQPTQFEKDRTLQGSALSRGASGAWSGLKAMLPSLEDAHPEGKLGISDIPGIGTAVQMGTNAARTYQKERDSGQGVIPAAASAAGGALGLDTQGIKERAQQGDVAGVIGEGIPAIAATLAGGELAEHAPAIAKKFPTATTLATAPIRYGARAAEDVINSHLLPLRSAKGLMLPADEAAAMKVQIPGRDVGLPAPTPAKPFVPQGPTATPEQLGTLRAVSKEPFELTPPPQETTPAIQQQMEFPAANEIAFRTDANGTRWAKTPDSPAEVSIPKNLSDNEAQQYAQGKLDLQSNFAKGRSPMGQLDELMKQQGGAPPGGRPSLEPGIPLREQRQLQKPFGNRAAVDVSEMHGPRTTAPEQIPQAIPNAVDQAMGGDLTPEAIEKERLQEKYPDAGDRQAIHRTSEKTFEATRDNPELRKALGDLKAHDNQGGPDLARAAANLGEDLGERRIGNKKAEWMGAGQIGRGEMFDRLLDKGYTPQQILDAAQAEPQSIPTLAKPGPARASRQAAREKAGD